MNTRIGMVAGEPSGDLLAGRIIAGLQARDSSVRCEGIGGPQMQAREFDAWHPMHALTVFGYVDALKRLPSLLATYRDVKRRWLAEPPKVFVGIDAPDFNLRLEHQLRLAGTPTVHFVGPSIWAWRYERIHKIRESVSHMLVLFPFEEEIYRKENIPVTYVGHPLAGAIPMEPDRAAARASLGIDQNARVLAILPGSRSSEIRLLAPRFLQAAQLLMKKDPALQCVVPMVNDQRRAEFQAILAEHPVPGLRCITADDLHGAGGDRKAPVAWSVMEAANAVLVASGTATLETALYKRPMVISYVLSPWMRRIMSWKSGQQRPYLPWVGLPNVLLRDFAVPELLQDDATPDKLAEATWASLTDDALIARVEARFTAMHQELLRDTPALAAQAILEWRVEQPDLFAAPAQPALVTAGVDEAGRGPLAGAVYAAAVILNPARPIDGLADSKVLKAATREALALEIQEHALAWCIASASVQEIDTLNILRATMLAMQRAVQGLSVPAQLALVDGNQAPKLACTVQTVIKGDALVPAISAASILAKTARDADLVRLHGLYPQYAFDQHKGYGTALHLQMLREHGPCAEHRRSFAPIKAFGLTP